MAAPNVKRAACLLFQSRIPLRLLHLRKPNQNLFRAASTDVYTPNEEEEEEFKQRLQRLRDASGLNEFERCRLYGVMPEFQFNKLKKRKMSERYLLRRMYALYGSSSGVKPNIMWPSKEELKDLEEIEEMFEPKFEEMKQTLESQKKKEIEEKVKREKKVEAAMSKMDSLIKEYQNKQEKLQQTGQKEQVKEWLAEFRETYGFSVHPSSLKFKAFRQKKIEELIVSKKQEKRLSKKQQSEQYLKDLLEKGSGSKY